MFHSRNVHYIPVPLACKKCATSNFPPRALDARSKCRARGDQHDGTSFSSLSLSLFPSFISELITRTLVNRVCSRWPQKCSRTHHLRRSELGSRFVVHWRGGVAAQSSVSYLSLSLCLCRSRRPANLNVGQLCTGLCSSTNARFPKRGLGRCSPNKKGHRVRPLANEVEVVKGGRGQLSTDNSWTMKVWDLG